MPIWRDTHDRLSFLEAHWNEQIPFIQTSSASTTPITARTTTAAVTGTSSAAAAAAAECMEPASGIGSEYYEVLIW